MISPKDQKKEVRDAILDAELNVKYWSYLSRRYYTRDRYYKIFLAIMSSGTVASWGFWKDVDIVWQVLSGISAIISLSLPIIDWPQKINKMNDQKRIWANLRVIFHEIWDEINSNNPRIDIMEKKRNAMQDRYLLSEGDFELPFDRSLIERCRLEVVNEWKLNNKI